MASIRADAQSVPVTFPVGPDGFAMVTSTILSLRFQFCEDAMYVEEEIFEPKSGVVLETIS